MHLPGLLGGGRRAAGLGGSVLSATGFLTSVPFLLAGLATVLLFPNGEISAVGPISLQPAVPVILCVPLLLSIACGIAHTTWPSPVVRRTWRIHLARAFSYALGLGLAVAVLRVGTAVGSAEPSGGALRNLLWMSGLAIATTALAGIAYTWVPVMLSCSAGILSAPTEDPWTLNGMLFHATATPGQLVLSVAICAAGLLLGVWDPVSRGYLKTSA